MTDNPLRASASSGREMEFDANIGIAIPPVSCGIGCKKLWERKAIHVNRVRVAVFDTSLATETETKVDSSLRFKAYLFHQCDSDIKMYRLICSLADIDYNDQHSLVKMKSVLKVKQIFQDILERHLLEVLN